MCNGGRCEPVRRELHADAITVSLRITSALLRNHPLPWIVDRGSWIVDMDTTPSYERERFALSSSSRSGNWARSN